MVRAPRIISDNSTAEAAQEDIATVKLLERTENGWKVVRTDANAVTCKTASNGHTKGWLIRHEEAVEKKCHTSITRWVPGEKNQAEARRIQRQWQEKINGGELVPETSIQIDAEQTTTRYSFDRARMCDGLEKSILETRETGDDLATKQARRIINERNKKPKIGKKGAGGGWKR